jgi:hypothetical protein
MMQSGRTLEVPSGRSRVAVMASQIVAFGGPEISGLLQSWSGGHRNALEEVATVLHGELKRLPHPRLPSERPAPTLTTAGLVREAVLRPVDMDLHLLGDLTQVAVGDVLEVSRATVARDLRFAVVCLAREVCRS